MNGQYMNKIGHITSHTVNMNMYNEATFNIPGYNLPNPRNFQPDSNMS